MSSAFVIRDHGAEGFRAERGAAQNNSGISVEETPSWPTSGSSGISLPDSASQESLPETVVRLLHEIPSARVLAELAAIDPQELPHASRIDYLTAIERQESWIQALMHRAVVAVGDRRRSERRRRGGGSQPDRGDGRVPVDRCGSGSR